MDKFLKTLKEIQELAEFKGTQKEFIASNKFLPFCSKYKLIPTNLKKGDMTREKRNLYIDYLVSLTQEYVDEKKIVTWEEFKVHDENKKAWKILFNFGVRGELEFKGKILELVQKPLTRLTLEEFYELCQIQFHYDGSFGAFKKMISKKYGSFAEYCLERGYDINNTNWENEETALRVARKIGSLEEVKEKSASLYKYLYEKNIHIKIGVCL